MRHFIVHTRRAGHVIARPLNCGVRRMKPIVFLLGVMVSGCVTAPLGPAPPEYLSNVAVRVAYVGSESRPELEVRNLGARTIVFAAPLFTFSDSRERSVCNLATQFSDIVPVYEDRTLAPRGIAMVPIVENRFAGQHVGIYVRIPRDEEGNDRQVVWSQNRQR